MEDLYAEHDKAIDKLLLMKAEVKTRLVKTLKNSSDSIDSMLKAIPDMDSIYRLEQAINYSIGVLKDDITYLELNAQNEKEKEKEIEIHGEKQETE